MNHLRFSGATDVTGKALAERLGLDSGKTKPRNADVAIGWGCKTKDDVSFPADTKVLNHPNAIRDNRNKQHTLNVLVENRNTKSSIAKHVDADDVIGALAAVRGRNNISLPIIGRTRMHQGGKGFWLCVNESQVRAAIAEGAHYFQEFIDIKQEYRLHVFCGVVIYAQKKVENASVEGWVAQRKEKIKAFAEKKDADINEDTMDFVLRRLVKEAVLPDRIVRSNMRGWKFSSVRPDNINEALKNAAIASVAAVGLDFGAVDCALGQDDAAWIIEINSGPGLQGSSLDAYVSAFEAKIAELVRPVEVEAAPEPRRNARRANRAARGPVRAANGRFAARGAVGAAVNEEGVAVNPGMALVMGNVANDEEARAVIDALLNRG